jgi:hypothetical protein
MKAFVCAVGVLALALILTDHALPSQSAVHINELRQYVLALE